MPTNHGCCDGKVNRCCKSQRTVCGCVHFITNSDLPKIINTPGNYTVPTNLVFTGLGTAIIVQASHVDINFCNHTLTLENPASEGIFMQNVTNVKIHDGVIQSLTPSVALTSNGINLVNTRDVTIDNIKFYNVRRGVAELVAVAPGSVNLKITNSVFNQPGAVAVRALSLSFTTGIEVDNCVFEQMGTVQGTTILLTNASDIKVTNSRFLNTNGSNASGITMVSIVRDCANVLIENCTFNNCRRGIDANSQSAIVRNLQIRNCVGTRIGLIQLIGTGILVEDSTFSGTPDFGDDFAIVFIGNDLEGPTLIPGRDVTLRNCRFISTDSLPTYNGVWASFVDGLLIDKCIIDSNGSGLFQPSVGFTPPVGNIHLGSLLYPPDNTVPVPGQGTNANNVRIVDCIIRGASQYGIVSESGGSPVQNQNIVIDNCTIDGASENGILFYNTSNSTVKNCSVRNTTTNPNPISGNGIVIGSTGALLPEFYTANALSNFNVVENNDVTSNDNSGILVQPNVVGNIVRGNNAAGNGIGLNNQAGNLFVDNVSCNNIINCVGIPANLVGSPGSVPVTLGQNICCSLADDALQLQEIVEPAAAEKSSEDKPKYVPKQKVLENYEL